MKKSSLILIALVFGSPCFASATALSAPVSYAAALCDPGFCFGQARAGNEMTQGLTGYERQVQRVLEPATENAPTSQASKVR
ncbi:hypothetical protein [Pantoea sp. BAV 3049]|uniref:hypothetical protein n=1 Tax=Pantoea sp. BAV 3049 TaxID=2654188 RepID=UPI00131C2E5F|nr:hypothetical protein [Pantoea sp. BAV 3049]